MFTPNTNLRLINVPFQSDLKSTLWFPNEQTQAEYFISKTIFAIDDFNYIKKDNVICVGGNVEKYWQCNYCMYRNNNVTNKWFYAFIIKAEWASANSTKLYLSTDPIQTWLFDIMFYTSYISRQHSVTDDVGDNIQPEPFSVSATKYQNAGSINCEPDWIQVYASQTPSGVPVGGFKSSGVYSGVGQVFYDTVSPDNMLNQYVENGTADAVAKIQQACSMGDSVGPKESREFNYSKHPSNVDGYVPKNNKILSGAFCSGYFGGFGQICEFIPEFCVGNGCTVKVLQDITSGSLYFYVPDYGMTEEGEDNVFMGFMISIPESSWSYNQYKNDYNLHNTSNSMMKKRLVSQQDYSVLRNAASIATNAVDAVASYAPLSGDYEISDNVLSAMDSGQKLSETLGGYDEISQQLQYIAESYSAPATGNVAVSNPFIAGKQWYVNYGWIVPDKRFARAYDDFLTVYGYAQNVYAIPNIHARKSWTYIKVPELMFDLVGPDEDANAIKRAFSNGLFFWSYDATYGNFDQPNPVL